MRQLYDVVAPRKSTTSVGVDLLHPLRSQYVFRPPPRSRHASPEGCDEIKDFIETAQKLVDAWDADPDNCLQLEEGLTALNAALQK